MPPEDSRRSYITLQQSSWVQTQIEHKLEDEEIPLPHSLFICKETLLVRNGHSSVATECLFESNQLAASFLFFPAQAPQSGFERKCPAGSLL